LGDEEREVERREPDRENQEQDIQVGRDLVEPLYELAGPANLP
jgi:hypothetical protein